MSIQQAGGHLQTVLWIWKHDMQKLELGRFSKNGRSLIFRFYVSLFPISDSDPIFTVAEIALGFCNQQRVRQRLLRTIQSTVPLD